MSKVLHAMSSKELVELHNQHADAAVKKFPSKAIAVRRTAEVLKQKGVPFPEPQADKKTRKRKASGPLKETRAGKMRALFATKKIVKIEEIEKATDWDRKNVILLMGRVKNRKVPFNTTFDKDKGTFTKVD